LSCSLVIRSTGTACILAVAARGRQAAAVMRPGRVAARCSGLQRAPRDDAHRTEIQLAFARRYGDCDHGRLLFVDRPAIRSLSAVNAAQEDGPRSTSDPVVVTSREVAVQPVPHTVDATSLYRKEDAVRMRRTRNGGRSLFFRSNFMFARLIRCAPVVKGDLNGAQLSHLDLRV
jgi:hypothetical protein